MTTMYRLASVVRLLAAEVVDLAQRRKERNKRELYEKLQDVSTGVSEHWDREKQAWEEYREIKAWIERAEFKPAGFDSIDEALWWIGDEIGYGYQALPKNFHKLGPDAKRTIVAIIKAAPEMLEHLEICRKQWTEYFIQPWTALKEQGAYHTYLDAVRKAESEELFHIRNNAERIKILQKDFKKIDRIAQGGLTW